MLIIVKYFPKLCYIYTSCHSIVMDIAMKKKSHTYPDYENPPVIEVVCGVLFKSIDTLLAPHFGTLWQGYKKDYPLCQEQPPLAPIIEKYDAAPQKQFHITEVPPLPRIWFVSSDDRGVVQIQRDRFLHNWKKANSGDEYPRYGTVISLFKNRLSIFEKFLSANNIGQIEPIQYEMTYVNHIIKGEGWDNMGEIGKLFPDFCLRTDPSRFLPGPDVINWKTTYVLPNRKGRMHVTLRNGVLSNINKSVIVMELTVRGIGEDKSREAMWPWFDTAREWIVKGFSDLTSKEAQEKIWKRK